MIRAFLALALSPEVTARLDTLALALPGARVVAARNRHVTLRFLGEIDEATAEDLHERLLGLDGAPFDLDLDGFGLFGGATPHTLWAGVVPSPALERLAAKTERLAVAAGLPPEGRKFTPHITLARLNRTPMERISMFLAENSPFHAGPMPVRAVTLFRSHLSRNGAEYEVLADYPLNG